MKKCLTALLIVAFVFCGCGNEKTAETPASPPAEQKAEQKSASAADGKFFSNGQFKVGADLPAGEYLAVGTGYVEVANSSEANKILYNDNIENAQRYVDAHDGEYVKVTGDIKLYPVADAPKISVQGKVPSGQFKAGSDIVAGEYKITLDAGGYFAVTKSTGHDYVKNQFTNEGGSFYATVADGQFLQIKKGSAEFVSAATPQPAQPAVEQIPSRISLLPSIGSTRADFDSLYTATNKNHIGYIRYNQDVWHAQFLDDKGDDSDTAEARAYMVTVQVLPGLPLEMTGIEELIPTDAVNMQYDTKGSDNVVSIKNFTGTSAQIAKIFPKSKGNFSGGFNWDTTTGKFIGGTIMVDHPFPPGKK